MKKANNNIITEKQLRRIIREEIENHLIQEGVWDDVKGGALKLSKKATAAFGNLAQDWIETIKEKLEELSKMPDDVLQVMEAIKYAMKESGESIPLDDTLKMAKDLQKSNPVSIVQSDLTGPVHDLAKKEQMTEIYAILSNKNYINSNRKQLNELGVTSVIGVTLAMLGGVPMLLKGLMSLAKLLGAMDTAEILNKAYHVTHKFEKKAIDFIVPDILSYKVYKFLFDRGFHIAKEKNPLSLQDFKKGKDGARQKTDELIYKCLLVYFAFSGLTAAFKAGASLIGFIEGAATGVKGVEIAAAGTEIAAIVRAGVKVKAGA